LQEFGPSVFRDDFRPDPRLIPGRDEKYKRDMYRRCAKIVAESNWVSEGHVSLLKSSVDLTIERGMQRDALVQVKTKDKNVSTDETFFKISETILFVIIVRGYQSSKVILPGKILNI
jgi:hypothetical protein